MYRFVMPGALLLAIPLFVQGCSREEPPIHLNPNMDRQPRYAAQAESTFFYNEAAEPLWELINTTTDFEERREAVLKVNDLLMEDHSWANVYFSIRMWPVNTRIKNFIDPPGRGAYMQWDQIWCDTC